MKKNVLQTKLPDIIAESPSLESQIAPHMEVLRKSIGAMLREAIDEIASTSPEKYNKIEKVTVKARYALVPEEAELSIKLKK